MRMRSAISGCLFFSMQAEPIFASMMNTLLDFADWFEEEGMRRMGNYTSNVDSFVERNAESYRWRDDRFACLRSHTEYHLNMFGAEIMNRAYAAEFQLCSRKTILAPGCMRARPENECQGI